MMAAIKAGEMGVEVNIVLNCGSYQLDYVPVTIDILEEVIFLCLSKISFNQLVKGTSPCSEKGASVVCF